MTVKTRIAIDGFGPVETNADLWRRGCVHGRSPQSVDPTKAGKLTTIAGGGETVAALNSAGVTGNFTYVSTAGGAFPEWLEGKSLPGIQALPSERKTLEEA